MDIILVFTFIVILFTKTDAGVISSDIGYFETNLSYHSCKSKCENNIHCIGMQYFRLYNLCKLYDYIGSDFETEQVGVYKYIKPEIVKQEQTAECNLNIQSAVCRKYSCDMPYQIPNTVVNGNCLTVGAKLRYNCIESGIGWTITCQDSYEWTPILFTCTCAIPPGLYHGVARIVALNETFVGMDIDCDNDYELIAKDQPVCDMSTAEWSNYEYVCCDKILDGHWMKIFSLASEVDISSTSFWFWFEMEMDDVQSKCTFRNQSALRSWNDLPITRVKLDVIKDDAIVEWILFNGTGSTVDDWLYQDRIIESSWSDLTRSTTIQKFGISVITHVKFSILENFNSNDCTQDRGWLSVVSAAFYPCNLYATPYRRVLYSTIGGAGAYNTSDIGVADRIVVWIEV